MIERDSNCMSSGYYRFRCVQTSFETLIERGEIGVFVMGSSCSSWNSLPVQGRKHFCQPAAVEVGGCQETKAGVRWRLLCQNKNRPLVLSSLFACCKVVYELLRERRPSRRAGDGTRTRDSLLGRQSVARTPFARYKLALEAPLEQ
jgi:hypothetical protein